ncbi:ATP-binding cassette domain-containing protein [Streptomyces sp. NPDC088730]|uniref:ATP-binding cassette domain-containing protein n=1 Tax=Streptomyces sp. NPDC088730 TaxID=3365877 RepID=UPI0038102DE4
MRLRGVGRRYGLAGPWVLRGVDLALPARALVRIEGANGTGKSTLLRLLARVDAPTEGRISGGRPRTAYVPERFPAALPFTAAGYLVHLGRVHGLRTAEAAARADAWLTRFGAAGHARTRLAELSKGTSQKVAVAQALLAEPELLVLDEAWTGLDAAARQELDRAVAERVAAGATVVFVDHDPRRLAGAAGHTFRVEGQRLVGVPRAPAGTDPGPRVRIDAVGPPGGTAPAGLPGDPEQARRADGVLRLTVSAAHSDALLSALLAARPPWHIRRLAPVPEAPPSPAEADADAAPASAAATTSTAPAPAPSTAPGEAP